MTELWHESDLAAAASAIREGELVAFPTETVYGLGGDATSDAAVAAIYAAKGRPRCNPLILHVAGAEAALRVADMPPGALALMERDLGATPMRRR